MEHYLDNYHQKIEVPTGWTKYLLVTHPVVFITTIGRVNGELMTNIAPFATCLDTSYNPPYVTFSAALRQHTIHGQQQTRGRMNTYSNIKQNGLFIVNVPDENLLQILHIVARPYPRGELEDKINNSGLTKLQPFAFPKRYPEFPPLIGECLAHLECRTIDIHRPRKSDHYNITGEVIGASLDRRVIPCISGDFISDSELYERLYENLDKVRKYLTQRTFHHFGASSIDPSIRYIALTHTLEHLEMITFELEKR